MCEKCEQAREKEIDMVKKFHGELNNYVQEHHIDLISLRNVLVTLLDSVEVQLTRELMLREVEEYKKTKEAHSTPTPSNDEPKISFTDADFEKLISEV